MFGANPDKKGRSSHFAPVSSKRTLSHSAAIRAPEENECRLLIPDLPSSPVRKRTSFRTWGREMLDTIFATSGLNLRVESMSRTRAMAGSGTGRKGDGFEGSTYMRQVGGSMR